MAAPSGDNVVDNFKHIYKRFKRRDRPLDVSGVLSFSSDTNFSVTNVEEIELNIPQDFPKFPGLKPVAEWKGFQLKNCKGFIVIPNPFEPLYQRYWVARCLLDFPVKPNRTNLDAHMERPSQIWHQCVKDDSADLSKDSLLMKLRWATLGYQYEWNTKEYFADRVQAFPDDLSHLCSYIAEVLGYSDYSSEAGIVNYYRMDSALMGHTDVSELDKAAPLISFSFGQSCIFLIGGPTKETEPIPLFLNSGDICLMTGSARLSYHAVPRILPGNPEHLRYCFFGDQTLASYCDRKSDDMNDTNVMKGEDCRENSADVDKKHFTENTFSKFSEDSEVPDEDPYSETANQKPPEINIVQSHDSIAAENETLMVTPTVKGNNCSVKKLQELMDTVIAELNWEPFHAYLNRSRVNVNVRQVLKTGLSLGLSPETITPCQRNCNKSVQKSN